MPNKATSKAQFRFLKGVAEGTIKDPDLTAKQAKELLGKQTPTGLPERKRTKK